MIIFPPPGAVLSLFASSTASRAPKASSPPVLNITETSLDIVLFRAVIEHCYQSKENT